MQSDDVNPSLASWPFRLHTVSHRTMYTRKPLTTILLSHIFVHCNQSSSMCSVMIINLDFLCPHYACRSELTVISFSINLIFFRRCRRRCRRCRGIKYCQCRATSFGCHHHCHQRFMLLLRYDKVELHRISCASIHCELVLLRPVQCGRDARNAHTHSSSVQLL